MSILTEIINPLQWGALATVTIDPIMDLIAYVHPRWGAKFRGRMELLENGHGSINQIVDSKVIRALYKEVRAIRECAGLSGEIRVYTGIGAHYEGKGSRIGHALVVPLEQMVNKIFNSSLIDEPYLEAEELQKTKNTFTDNEVRFQIARSVSKMGGYSRLKIIARVMIVALAIFLVISPLGWLGGWIIFGATSLLYASVDYYVERKSDARAIKILTKRFVASGYTPLKAEIEATKAARNCLKKIAQQNIDKRKGSRLYRLLVTKSGSLPFDLVSPLLTNRIKKLEKSLVRLQEKSPCLANMPTKFGMTFAPQYSSILTTDHKTQPILSLPQLLEDFSCRPQ